MMFRGMGRHGFAITLAFLGFLTAMSSTACTHSNQQASEQSTLDSIPSERWEALAKRPIYFGHQSVGRDILAGIREIVATKPSIALKVLPTGETNREPGIHEFPIGDNGNPASKLQAFTHIIETAAPPPNSILMMKFCYVDTKRDSDVDAMFESYVQTVEALRKEYPGRTILHFTMPLTTSESNAEFMLRKVLGRYSRRELNAKRNRFNALLRNHYEGKDPIFDLARAESTHSDGTRASFVLNGQTGYQMAPEWTSDGGHLSPQGRVHVAEALMSKLASL